ncbi:MAG TPA: hypothetical protein VEM39_00130 [Myxococcaceae bacterium]|nr:hypothetical protein [Myxococcaceae bacterium]
MARRTGTADLPLHYGRVPKWLSRARLGNDDKLAALRALDRESRRLAGVAGPSFNEIVSREQRISASLDGRVARRGPAVESISGVAGGTTAHG